MKRNHFYFAVLLGGLLLAASGCDKDGTNSVESESVVDTVSIRMECMDSVGTTQLSCSMKGVLPNISNKQLKRIINEWINERLGGTYSIKDIQNTDSILRYYQQNWMDSTKAWVNELPDGLSGCIWEQEFQIMAQNKKYITLSLSSFRYEGGAHGKTIIGQQTFRKEDGRELGWYNMFNMENEYKIRELIKKGLIRYFDIKPGEELKDYLLNPENAFRIPLPVTPPVLLDDGIMFIYQQYEIAPYAFGLPQAVVPYDEIIPLLTITAQELLDD